MYKLLPEFWSLKEEEAKASSSSKLKVKKRIKDINTCLQCYALFVSVVAQKSPQQVSELMSYTVDILRASQEYKGAAWAAYDAVYRHQTAATGHKDWSKVNPSRYIVCFKG